MTPREYVDEIVRPNLAELENDEGNPRHALNAVHAVDALAARIYVDALAARIYVAADGRDVTGALGDDEYRKMLADQHADLALLRDLAKAVKHAVLKRGSPIVGSASQVEVKAIGWDQTAWGEFAFDIPPQAVVILDDGAHRVIAAVV